MGAAKHDGPSVIERLAAYGAGESFPRLPKETVAAARRAILDTLGVMLAGALEDTAVRARALIVQRSASSDAAVVGTPLRASIADAALVNGVAAHALDYDDVQASLSGHPSVPVLPAALALAERERASGAALLTAFVVGVEVEANLVGCNGELMAELYRQVRHPAWAILRRSICFAPSNRAWLTQSQFWNRCPASK